MTTHLHRSKIRLVAPDLRAQAVKLINRYRILIHEPTRDFEFRDGKCEWVITQDEHSVERRNAYWNGWLNGAIAALEDLQSERAVQKCRRNFARQRARLAKTEAVQRAAVDSSGAQRPQNDMGR